MPQHTFICYTHENSRFAKKLAGYLDQHGIVVWLDQWNLPQEEAWDKAIEHAIRHCRYFLMILSPAAVNSWVVRSQFEMAKLSGKAIVPVLRQPCQLPEEIQHLQPIDLVGHNFRRGFWQLLQQFSGESSISKGEMTVDWVGLLQTWLHRLLPLLWPGWLGPLLLVFLLVSSSALFWPDVGSATFSATPAAERVVVVFTPSPESFPWQVRTRVRVGDGKMMVYVPAGEFLMGSTETDLEADEDEKPRHPVYLDAYWIDKTEVTNIQYQLCVRAGACTMYQSQGKRFEEDDNQPAVGVTWFQAQSYCAWAGGRLPTEAEWEKAARGTDGRIFPWGNEFDGTRLNYCDRNCIADWRDMSADDHYAYTAPVGIYLNGASPYGALDMSGNVWEWTADWYAADSYSRSAYKNPTGPPTGQQRVVRGGSWYYYGKNLRAAKRHRDLPTYSYYNIGFRCVVGERE